MPNLHESKLLHNLKPRLLLLSIVAFLVFAGPALTLLGSSKALVAEPPGELSSSAFSLNQSHNGAVNTADCTKVTGWAEDLDDYTATVYVDIYINGVLKATIPANRCIPIGSSNCHNFTYSIPASLKDGQELAIKVTFSGTGIELPGSPQTIRCGASLFGASTPPGPVTSVSGEGKTWEQAVQMSSTESGQITHILFWLVPEESGSHTGRIWSDTGTLLRSVNFPNVPPGSSGWQIAKLSSPLTISAGVKFRVSYNVNYYGGKIVLGLQSPYLREPLIAWRGFYSTPSGTFPNTSSVSNFLADVILNVPR